MKYYLDIWEDARCEYARKEITKEEAILILSSYYNKPEECAEWPCYYRTMCGGIEVVAE